MDRIISGTGLYRILVGLRATTLLVWGLGLGGWAQVYAAHSTCGLISSVPGGEPVVEAAILNYLKSQPPTTFSDKVKVGSTPLGPVKVKVKVTIKDPKDVDLKCTKSDFSYKFGIKATVSGKAGSSTHNGTGRIEGHYTVSPTPKVCVNNLRLAGLNLENVQNKVDQWIRGQINSSDLTADFPCLDMSASGG